MTDNEKLYETLGELIYVVALADGIIDDSERKALDEILKKHSYADEIKWSFKYEESKQNSVEDVYSKVIAVCHRIGPSPIYEEFIQVMNTMANADETIDESESKVINSFSADLIERFKKDIERVKK